MSYEAVVDYLGDYNLAVRYGAPVPPIDVLPTPEAARVTRFLALCGSAAVEPPRSRIRDTLVPNEVNGSLGSENMRRLAQVAEGLRLGFIQQGEQ